MSVKDKYSTLHIAVMFDTRRKLTNGKYPFRLRITLNRVRYYFKISLEATKELFAKSYELKPRNEAKILRDQISAIEVHAKSICDNMSIFTPEAFKNEFFKEVIQTPHNDVFAVFKFAIDSNIAEGRIGNANMYKSVMRSISSFENGKLKEHSESTRKGKKQPEVNFPKLQFESITQQWLKRYIVALNDTGASASTQGIYLRTLRSIINLERANNKNIPQLFGKGKIEIPISTKNKRALPPDAIKSIFDYKTQTEPEQRAKDLWIFSYLCCGLNVADIVQLKYHQLKFDSDGCTIEFIRAKTQRKADKTKIVIELDVETASIISSVIKRHGNRSKDGYVFPYLNGKTTPQDQYLAKVTLIRLLNRSLRKIAENLKLPIDLTTYVARHSYATTLLRSGVSVAEISESLGHSDLKTTENYLGGFSKESKRLNSAKLLHS